MEQETEVEQQAVGWGAWAPIYEPRRRDPRRRAGLRLLRSVPDAQTELFHHIAGLAVVRAEPMAQVAGRGDAADGNGAGVRTRIGRTYGGQTFHIG
jgi:hypothetical protein